MNGKIYKITNTITNESYIGKTIQPIGERFNEHKRGTLNIEKDKTKFHKAMAEYGHRNFEIELIEENITCPIMLGLKETMAILEYGTLREYNSMLGRRSVPAGYGTEEWDYEKYREKQNFKRKKTETVNEQDKLIMSMKNPFLFHSDLIEILTPIKTLHEFNILTTILHLTEVKGDSYSLDLEEFKKELRYDSDFYVGVIVDYIEKLNSSIDDIGVFNKLEASLNDRTITVELSSEYAYLIGSKNDNFVIDLSVLDLYDNIYYKKLYLLISTLEEIQIEVDDLVNKINAPVAYNVGKLNAKIIFPFLKESTRIGNPYNLEKINKGNKRLRAYLFTQ